MNRAIRRSLRRIVQTAFPTNSPALQSPHLDRQHLVAEGYNHPPLPCALTVRVNCDDPEAWAVIPAMILFRYNVFKLYYSLWLRGMHCRPSLPGLA